MIQLSHIVCLNPFRTGLFGVAGGPGGGAKFVPTFGQNCGKTAADLRRKMVENDALTS